MTRALILTSLALSLTLSLAGCPNEETDLCEENPDMPGCDEDGGGPTDAGHDGGRDGDAGDRDGGVDGGPSDAGPCGGACSGETPVCNTTTGACVECVGGTDCADDAVCSEDNECVACLADAHCEDTPGTPVCDTEAMECVGCLERADCTDPATPACDGETQTCVECTGASDCAAPGASVCDVDANECVGCASDAGCAHLADTPVCDEASATCVVCTPDSEVETCDGPDMRACNPNTFECTGAPRGSLGFCQPCVSDSECPSSPTTGTYRCVETQFEGEPNGKHCLLDFATCATGGGGPGSCLLCPRRMTVLIEEQTSALGVTSDYCFPNQGLTTCTAIVGNASGERGYKWGPCTADSDCGAPGLDDGVCRASRCTYECSSPQDCPPSSIPMTNPCSGTPTTCNPNL